jgi:sugar lactone lactonase YvrE
MKRGSLVPAVFLLAVLLITAFTGRLSGRTEAAGSSVAAANQRFSAIGDITTDRQGNVYVTDYGRCQVQKLSPAGCRAGYGALGPVGIALDRTGNVWVTTGASTTVTEYSPTGRVLTKWGSPEMGPGAFTRIMSIGVSPQGQIALADVSEHHVLFYTPRGKYIRTVGTPGMFQNWLCSLAWDAKGNLYVCDTSDGLIRKFSPAGKSIAVYGKGKLGTFIHGLALDRSGTMYVQGQGILKISPAGKVSPFSFEGGGEGIAVDPSGDIWAAGDSTTNPNKWPPTGFLQKFSPSGKVLLTLFKPR